MCQFFENPPIDQSIAHVNLTDRNSSSDEEALHCHLSLKMTNAVACLRELKSTVISSDKSITDDDIIRKHLRKQFHTAWIRDVFQRLLKCTMDYN